jgi:hypothetical protein
MHLIADAMDIDDHVIFTVGIDNAFELANHCGFGCESYSFIRA